MNFFHDVLIRSKKRCTVCGCYMYDDSDSDICECCLYDMNEE